jgi:uncharacterized protein YeeX (DUF496 family)|tara:strand:- start:2868 stop:3344 length:477 start_codon:yes stop_codon:yes gene_type:complete
MNEAELKTRFADALLRDPNNPFAAAQSIGVEQSRIMEIATTWPIDDEVLKAKNELLEKHGAREFLPSREEAARLIWDKAQNSQKAEDVAKLMKIYGDYMGFIEKPGLTVNNTQNVLHVMRVPMPDSVDDWEAKAISHQSNITSKMVESDGGENVESED